MRRVIAAAILALAALALTLPTAPTEAQEPCRFVLGFAALRDLVGAQKVGTCLEDEHFNLENGNSEQRTSGGLLVWRKIDNFTAFTDGGTSWVNGPEGLQTRPNSERFSWEKDPVQPARTQAAPAAPSSASSSGLPPAPTPTATATPGSAPQRSVSSGPTAAPPPATSTPGPTLAPATGPTLAYPGNGGGPTTCNDGSISHSSGRGTCSGHGGVRH